MGSPITPRRRRPCETARHGSPSMTLEASTLRMVLTVLATSELLLMQRVWCWLYNNKNDNEPIPNSTTTTTIWVPSSFVHCCRSKELATTGGGPLAAPRQRAGMRRWFSMPSRPASLTTTSLPELLLITLRLNVIFILVCDTTTYHLVKPCSTDDSLVSKGIHHSVIHSSGRCTGIESISHSLLQNEPCSPDTFIRKNLPPWAPKNKT
jgi:hypothetical protein